MDEREKLLRLYRDLNRVRACELKLSELFTQGNIPGFVHSGLGHEAFPAGALYDAKPGDYVMPHHRGFGYGLCHGISMRETIAEMCGRATGACKGKGGSHLAKAETGVMGVGGAIGTIFTIADGLAMTIKRLKKDNVVFCFFGDGLSNRGPFHSGLNAASIWKLPVVFICENNHWAITVPYHKSTAADCIADRAAAYKMPGVYVDGNDVLAVQEAVSEAVARARRGEGPSLVEGRTYRWQPHADGYPWFGSEEDSKTGREKDPIRHFKGCILNSGLAAEEDLKVIELAAIAEADEAAEFALSSPFPEPEEAIRGFYACEC